MNTVFKHVLNVFDMCIIAKDSRCRTLRPHRQVRVVCAREGRGDPQNGGQSRLDRRRTSVAQRRSAKTHMRAPSFFFFPRRPHTHTTQQLLLSLSLSNTRAAARLIFSRFRSHAKGSSSSPPSEEASETSPGTRAARVAMKEPVEVVPNGMAR